MTQKVILVADPGIDTAFAIALALHDPKLDVLGLVATAGNVGPEQATTNVHLLVNALDPPKWPRVGAALPVTYDVDGTKLHGPNGLGGVALPQVSLHAPTPGDKLLVELVHEHPHEATVVVLGPCTVLARALDRDPEMSNLLRRIVVLGGVWKEPGNSSPVAEFHFFCDPPAARQVLKCGAAVTVVPLEVTRKLIFSPSDLLNLPNPDSPACQFLRQIVPAGIRASSNLYGIEGFHLKDVLGVVAVAVPGAVTAQPYPADVEVRGELTRGMLVVDARPTRGEPANVDLAVGLDAQAARDYIQRTLARED